MHLVCLCVINLVLLQPLRLSDSISFRSDTEMLPAPP